MSWFIKIFLVFFLTSLLGLGAYFHSFKLTKDPVAIVCTTTILADTCKSLVGDALSVTSLMGPGIDPHLYQARPSDINTLKNARVLIYHGLHLEGKITSLLEELSLTHTVIDASEGCDRAQLRQAENMSLYDPHIWHDIILWMQVIQYIADQLIVKFPEHTESIKLNTQQYLLKLEATHAQIQQLVRSIPLNKRTLITAHDAFWYFGNRYGLEVVGLQGLSTDAGINIQDIEKIAHLIVSKNIPTIFIETSITERSLKAVQQAVNSLGSSVYLGKELYSDALGSPMHEADTYISMLMHNATAIAEGLTK
jgi:manganese/zinc/iron transport system substrate-binding protein